MMKRALIFTFILSAFCLFGKGENSAERTKRDFLRLGLSLYEGNKVTLLPTAEIKFRDLFQAVERAEKYIYLDYFKFQQDSICGLLLEKLQRKVREGVEVRIIFDSYGNSDSDFPLSDTLQASLRQSGIEIKAFDPVRFPWINHFLHRNHHKIAIIDGLMVYTGGMNVADYYLHGKPKVGKWRDMHIRMEGSIVEAYEGLFWKMWSYKSKDARPGDSQRRAKNRLRLSEAKNRLRLSEAKNEEPPAPERSEEPPAPERSEEHQSAQAVRFNTDSSLSIAFASRWPRETPKIMRQTYSICIDNAERLVQIVNPYAMLFGEVRAALRRALDRGVKVQFMVSTKCDSKLNDDVIGLEMRKLMKRGAEVWYYEDGFHHSKFMMIDSLFCTVGTTNLDARSLCFDYEVNAFIFSPTTTHQLQQIFYDDMENHSTLLTPEVFKERFPLRRRIRSRIFSISKRLI